VLEHGGQQVVTVLEVPVETALGHAAALGQHLDSQAAEAIAGQHFDGAFDPVSTVKLGPRARPSCGGKRVIDYNVKIRVAADGRVSKRPT
jgi:hypothetical protein